MRRQSAAGHERLALAAIAHKLHDEAELMFAQLVSDRKLGREELERMRGLLAERLKKET